MTKLTLDQLYNEIVNGKRNVEIAKKYSLSTTYIQSRKRILFEQGKLSRLNGTMQFIPDNPKDRKKFFINRIKSWKLTPEKRKYYLKVIENRKIYGE